MKVVSDVFSAAFFHLNVQDAESVSLDCSSVLKWSLMNTVINILF